MNSSERALMVKVWVGLLALTLAEAALAYVRLDAKLMLALLMGFSGVKAAMIGAYFMHLKYERPALSWMLVPPLLALIVALMAYLYPDSYRMLELAP